MAGEGLWPGMDSDGMLEDYLHKRIPLSAAIQVSVDSASTNSVTLSAPLEPNINPKSTVFGGSAAALAVLAAWSLLHLRLMDDGFDCEVVIQTSQMDYDRPIRATFSATSSLTDAGAWPAFLTMLARKRRSRIEVQSVLTSEGATVARLRGKFVALLREA